MEQKIKSKNFCWGSNHRFSFVIWASNNLQHGRLTKTFMETWFNRRSLENFAYNNSARKNLHHLNTLGSTNWRVWLHPDRVPEIWSWIASRNTDSHPHASILLAHSSPIRGFICMDNLNVPSYLKCSLITINHQMEAQTPRRVQNKTHTVPSFCSGKIFLLIWSHNAMQTYSFLPLFAACSSPLPVSSWGTHPSSPGLFASSPH